MLLHLPVRSAKLFFKLAILFVCLTTDGRAAVLNPPMLTWITNSSVKLEQIIGDTD